MQNCAIGYKELIKAQKPKKDLINNWIDSKGVPANKAYYYICVIKYLLDTVNPKNSFKVKLINLFEKYPNIDSVKAMGFQENWKEQPLWL